MRSGFALLLTTAVVAPVALSGCDQVGLSNRRFMPVVDTQYDCMPDGDGSGRHRSISIGPERNGTGVVLSDAGQRQVLTPVFTLSGPLFSSPLYAWKGDATGGMLTDVEAIQSFRCRRIGGSTTLTTHKQILRAAR